MSKNIFPFPFSVFQAQILSGFSPTLERDCSITRCSRNSENAAIASELLHIHRFGLQ
jgi:hypothetical protein